MNYCLKALQEKGLIKIKNFKKTRPQKGNYLYILTPQGIKEKTILTMNFMKRKLREYDELKAEIEELKYKKKKIIKMKNKTLEYKTKKNS